MLIDFSPDGRIEFTRNPTLLSLFPDQPKRMERMTDIRFDEQLQRHYITFLTGPSIFVGRPLSYTPRPEADGHNEGDCRSGRHKLWETFIEEYSPGLSSLFRYDGFLITFATYEDAVKVEVAFVDFLREQGFSMT